jgi:transposase
MNAGLHKFCKGLAVKCEDCGHDEVIFKKTMGAELWPLNFSLRRSWPCPDCGGKMHRDPSVTIFC